MRHYDFSQQAQQGYALVESVLVLPVMVTVFLAVIAIAEQQFYALQIGQISRHTAMSQTRGLIHVPRLKPTAAPISTVLSTHAAPSVASADFQQIEQAWLGSRRRLLKAESSLDISKKAWLPGVRMARVRWVAVGDAGHAHHDADMQQRLAKAELTWQQAARQSHRAAQALSSAINAAERPWGRQLGSLDWLSAWEDVAGMLPDAPERSAP